MSGKPHRSGACAIVVLLCLVLPATAAANTYEPTRKDDPVPNGCKPNNCSLREAISAANKDTDRDKVLLAKGRYLMQLPDDGNDDNENGDFDVLNDTVIAGKGPKKTTVDGQGIHGVFQFLTFDTRTIKNLTIQNGAASFGGGGIFIGPSDATVRNVAIRLSQTPSAGGGIIWFSPDLELDRVTLRGNLAGTKGGGIHLGVSISDSAVSIRNSTISGNVAEDGAGMAADETDTFGTQNQLAFDVKNSTIDGNQATDDGGGALAMAGATLALDNATVAHNKAETDGSGAGAGGGVSQQSAATFAVDDSIVAANTLGTTGTAPQCSGAFAGAGNLLSNPPGCSSFNTGSVLAADPKIGLLAANGGPTETVKLLTGSPAIGFAFTCPRRDQRGERRPGNCDSGAFENKPLRR